MESNKRDYSCEHCGLAFSAAPPDDFHPYSSIKKEELEDPVERPYKCFRCKQSTILYWGKGPRLHHL